MGKIENENQYQISKRLVDELEDTIVKLKNDTEKNELRKHMILTSLEVTRDDIKKEISDYEASQ